MKNIQIPMVRVCQVSSYLKAPAIIEFLEKEKDLGVLRIKVKHASYGTFYAAILVLEDGQEVLGKKIEMIPLAELNNELFYVGGMGEIKRIHLGKIEEKWVKICDSFEKKRVKQKHCEHAGK